MLQGLQFQLRSKCKTLTPSNVIYPIECASEYKQISAHNSYEAFSRVYIIYHRAPITALANLLHCRKSNFLTVRKPLTPCICICLPRHSLVLMILIALRFHLILLGQLRPVFIQGSLARVVYPILFVNTSSIFE